MSRWIKITFHDTSNLHKLHNCTEELSVAIDRLSWGSLPFDEAERATDHVRIVDIPARQLRRAISFVEEHLKAHFYDGSTTITSGSVADLK
jgi:hypothetical protein